MAKASKRQKIEEEMSTTPDFISWLPTKILVDEIFCRLDTKDRPKARQTCRQWTSAIRISDDRGRLFLARLPFRLGSDRFQIDADETNLALLSILSREGENLKSLSFEGNGNRRCQLGRRALELIVDFCLKLTSLRLIDVNWSSDMSGFDWSRLGRLTHLSEFQLEYVRPTLGEEEKFSAGLSQLISSWPLTKLSLQYFGRCPRLSAAKLTELSLRHARISNAQLTEVCRICSTLSSLKLTCHDPDLTDFSAIATLTDLRTLQISPATISNDDFMLICTGCLKLSRLEVYGCPSLTNFHCLTSLQNLKALGVGRRFDDVQVDLMPEGWPLEEFHQTHGRLTTSGLTTLSRKCPGLTVLSLYDCGRVTDKSMSHLIANCPRLESVDLRMTITTGDDLPLLLGHSRSLRTLKCPAIWPPDLYMQLQMSRQNHNVTTPLHLYLLYPGQLSAEQVGVLLSANIHIHEDSLSD